MSLREFSHNDVPRTFGNLFGLKEPLHTSKHWHQQRSLMPNPPSYTRYFGDTN
jgi:hypothetical protein